MGDVVYDYATDRYHLFGLWVDKVAIEAAPSRWWRLLATMHLMTVFPWLWAGQEGDRG